MRKPLEALKVVGGPTEAVGGKKEQIKTHVFWGQRTSLREKDKFLF